MFSQKAHFILFRINNGLTVFEQNGILYTRKVVPVMPEIARFYGIIIKMFFKPKEHEPCHIHALYGEYIGVFNIDTFEMTDGDLPLKAQKLVEEWLKIYQKELLEMWNTQVIGKLPPLV